MVLLKTFLILAMFGITVPATWGLPNIVFILLDDVDVELTGLKVRRMQKLIGIVPKYRVTYEVVP